MPVVNFATNQVMHAQDGTPMTLYTAPHPMGNGVNLRWFTFYPVFRWHTISIVA